MQFKKLAAAVAMAGLSLVGAGANAAAVTLSNTDGNLSPFTGFDWADGGVAWTTGFALPTLANPNPEFTLTYAAWAVKLNGYSTIMDDAVKLDTSANGAFKGNAATISYEYTIWATVKEKVESCGPTSCTFTVLGGDYSVYYDYKGLAGGSNAKTVLNGNWTGFTDGVEIIRGKFDPTPSSQTFNLVGSSGSNSTALSGSVVYTNTTYVNPALTGTQVTSTLQLGTSQTSAFTGVKPTSVEGIGFGANQIVFQADANQDFTNGVPEPGSVALIGLALAACGVVSRRRKA